MNTTIIENRLNKTMSEITSLIMKQSPDYSDDESNEIYDSFVEQIIKKHLHNRDIDVILTNPQNFPEYKKIINFLYGKHFIIYKREASLASKAFSIIDNNKKKLKVHMQDIAKKLFLTDYHFEKFLNEKAIYPILNPTFFLYLYKILGNESKIEE